MTVLWLYFGRIMTVLLPGYDCNINVLWQCGPEANLEPDPQSNWQEKYHVYDGWVLKDDSSFDCVVKRSRRNWYQGLGRLVSEGSRLS